MSDEETQDSPAREIADLLLRVYEIHQVVIAETGGEPGLRDPGLLHAAVARPFATYEGQALYPSDFEKAAALFHSLIKSHPFYDGAKRTALAAALYFLDRSGYTIPEVLPQREVVRFCMAVAAEGTGNATPVADIAVWLQRLLQANG